MTQKRNGTIIEELAAMVQRGFKEMKAEHAREHAETRAENAREHAETRAMLEDKPDHHEVVRRTEFDSLDHRVTQLELK